MIRRLLAGFELSRIDQGGSELRAARTHYEILGVPPTASAAELRTAYVRLLRQAHPDMGGSSAILDLVTEAYDALKDPAKRAKYDAALRRGVNKGEPASTGHRPPPSREDQPHEPPREAPFQRNGNPSRTARGPAVNTGVPHSRSGRVPQWVVDEALGLPPQHAVPWRGAYPSALGHEPRRHRRRSWSTTFTLAFVVLAIIGSALWLESSGRLDPGAAGALTSRPTNAPKPGREESKQPIGVPIPLATVSGSFRILAQQTDGTTPVAYDPCRPIHYVIRQVGEPAGGDRIVRDAVLRVSQATGLRFVDDGATTEAPSRQRASYQPNRYGDRWAPVLISWVTPNENPDFAADVAGQGGSSAMSLAGRPSVYVTGAVQLDSGKLARILQRPGGDQIVRAIVLHELGHLVGLDHVNAPDQLMYPQGQVGMSDFGTGDLTGLAALGRGSCVPDL